MKNGVKLIVSFNKGLKQDECLTIFLFKKIMIRKINKQNEMKKKVTN